MKIGDRVYVRELDVFGTIEGQSFSNKGTVTYVQCEPPMPGYCWEGDEDALVLASEVED